MVERIPLCYRIGCWADTRVRDVGPNGVEVEVRCRRRSCGSTLANLLIPWERVDVEMCPECERAGGRDTITVRDVLAAGIDQRRWLTDLVLSAEGPSLPDVVREVAENGQFPLPRIVLADHRLELSVAWVATEDRGWLTARRLCWQDEAMWLTGLRLTAGGLVLGYPPIEADTPVHRLIRGLVELEAI